MSVVVVPCFLQQNFGRICKIPISTVESLCVQQFSDVSGDLGVDKPIEFENMSPSSQLHKIASLSTPSGIDETENAKTKASFYN